MPPSFNENENVLVLNMLINNCSFQFYFINLVFTVLICCVDTYAVILYTYIYIIIKI